LLSTVKLANLIKQSKNFYCIVILDDIPSIEDFCRYNTGTCLFYTK